MGFEDFSLSDIQWDCETFNKNKETVNREELVKLFQENWDKYDEYFEDVDNY